jgi:hypothetical protein
VFGAEVSAVFGADVFAVFGGLYVGFIMLYKENMLGYWL